MAKMIINGEVCSGSSSYASAVEYIKDDGTKSTVQNEIDELNKKTQNTTYVASDVQNALFVKDSSDKTIVVPISNAWGYLPVTKFYMKWHETKGWCLCLEFVYNNDRIVSYYVPLQTDYE